MEKEYKEAIVSFLGNKEFPRDVAYRIDKGVLVRRKASNISQYCDFVERYGAEKDCYVSLFSRNQVAIRMFDTIFFDVDSMDFDRAIYKTEFVLRAMEQKFNDVQPRLYFSAHKGFHIYYDFDSVLNRTYSTLVRFLVKQRALSSIIDTQVLTDTVLRRIVYTKNTFTGLWCVPIERRFLKDTSKLLQAAVECNYEPIIIAPSTKLTAFLNLVKEDVSNGSSADGEEIRDSMPPCVTDAYQKTIMGVAQHGHRLLFASYITKFNLDDDAVLSMFRAAPDFVSRRTRYQVGYVRRRNIKVSRCSKIVQGQMCPLTDEQRRMCDWYPSINIHLPRLEVKKQ